MEFSEGGRRVLSNPGKKKGPGRGPVTVTVHGYLGKEERKWSSVPWVPVREGE